MTATTISVPTTNTRSLWKAGAAAAVSAAVATTAVAGIAHAAGVSLEVGGNAIPLLGFAQATLTASLVGIVLATSLSRWASHPRRAFVTTTFALTLVSFLPDVFADAANSTKVALILTHVVAASLVIPALARQLSE